jgi:hypothetical protein
MDGNVVVVTGSPVDDQAPHTPVARRTRDARAIPPATGEPSSTEGSQSGIAGAVDRALGGFDRWADEISEPAAPIARAQFPGVAAGFRHLNVVRNPSPSMAAVWADYTQGYRICRAAHGPAMFLPYHLTGIPGLACACLFKVLFDSCIRPARFFALLVTIGSAIICLLIAGVL